MIKALSRVPAVIIATVLKFRQKGFQWRRSVVSTQLQGRTSRTAPIGRLRSRGSTSIHYRLLRCRPGLLRSESDPERHPAWIPPSFQLTVDVSQLILSPNRQHGSLKACQLTASTTPCLVDVGRPLKRRSVGIMTARTLRQRPVPGRRRTPARSGRPESRATRPRHQSITSGTHVYVENWQV